MHCPKFSISRRHFLALTGAAVGSSFLPACSDKSAQEPGNQQTGSQLPRRTPPSFTLFYKPELTGNVWDTWIYYHEGTFYLYYNPAPAEREEFGVWMDVALATSKDGVHWQEHGIVIEATPGIIWLGAGSVWPAGNKFIMNFSELVQGPGDSTTQTIHFAESNDLVNWRRLGSEYAFNIDTSLYEPDGRWDNIWPIARPEGGFYGYWAAQPKNKQVGVGFGESDDGVTWRALPPALLEDVPLGGPEDLFPTPEVGAAYFHNGKYYLLAALNEAKPLSTKDFPDNVKSIFTTMVGDTASGPFRAAAKNRGLLVGFSSYFPRFVNIGDEVLLNHHSWESNVLEPFKMADPDRVWMAPLKRVDWDDEGTLRLMWWEQNNLAKGTSLNVAIEKSASGSQPAWLEPVFDPNKTLILEGEINLPDSGLDAEGTVQTGLYLQGTGDEKAETRGTTFLVRENGAVDFGPMKSDGTGFEKLGDVDRELSLNNSVRFRLVQKGRLTEFYLNDYLMQCYSLPKQGTGRIGLVGFAGDFHKLKAWYCV